MSFYSENREFNQFIHADPTSEFQVLALPISFILNFCVCVTLLILKSENNNSVAQYKISISSHSITKETSNSVFNQFDKPKDNNQKTEHSKNEHKCNPLWPYLALSRITLAFNWANSIPIGRTLPACRLKR